MTDNQRARHAQLKENEKKAAAARAAAARAAAVAAGAQSSSATASPPPTAARLSSTMSSWAKPCDYWKAGECTRGISCHFMHEGFPIEEKRCFVCKSQAHTSRECTCPGGRLDPQRETLERVQEAQGSSYGRHGKACRRRDG